MPVVVQLLKPLPPLLAASLAIAFAVLWIERGLDTFLLAIGLGTVLIALVYVAGRVAFGRWPYYGGFFMEAGLALLTLAAAAAGAVLLWLAIEHAPGEAASTREKQVWAAFTAAITAYLGSIVIKPDAQWWNPVKSAIKQVFGPRFQGRTNSLEKDAHDAVINDNYGATDPRHKGHVVAGWGWAARRLRTKHIQDAL